MKGVAKLAEEFRYNHMVSGSWSTGMRAICDSMPLGVLCGYVVRVEGGTGSREKSFNSPGKLTLPWTEAIAVGMEASEQVLVECP